MFKKLSPDRGKTEPKHVCHNCKSTNIEPLIPNSEGSNKLVLYICKDCGIQFIVDNEQEWTTST